MEKKIRFTTSPLPIREVITLEGAPAGYAFAFALDGTSYTITAVTRRYSDHVESANAGKPQEERIDDQFHVLTNDDLIKDPIAVVKELQELPDETLQRLMIPVDPVSQIITG